MARRFAIGWIAVTLGISIIAFLDDGWITNWLVLSPSRVWHGELWRLVTWFLIVPSPISLVVSCVVIYQFGGALVEQWGVRRFRQFWVVLVVTAGVVTCLVSLVTGNTGAHVGGMVTTFSLAIAWARQFPHRELVLYGVVTLSGRKIVLFLSGVIVLFALAFGIYAMAPELVACAIAAKYPRGWLRR
ncbi:MAG: rhomboid family intramembrane serine protease [Kofleriaceae bacterium]